MIHVKVTDDPHTHKPVEFIAAVDISLSVGKVVVHRDHVGVVEMKLTNK